MVKKCGMPKEYFLGNTPISVQGFKHQNERALLGLRTILLAIRMLKSIGLFSHEICLMHIKGHS